MASANRPWHKPQNRAGDGLETTSTLKGLPLRLVQIACVVFLLVKLAQWVFAGVFMDEAYYWMWGQHPALSYYDHPPLNAWLLGLSSAIFGWNTFALRLPVALAFVGDVVALALIARRVGGDWRGHFWLTLLIFLATPVFSMVSNYALPDHILLTALLFSIVFFFGFFADRARGAEGRTQDLMLGALFLGLAGLAKYNAAFLGIGIGLFVLFYDRTLLRQSRLYFAAGLSLALQLPVVIWNASERFASYGFILDGRHAGLKASLDGIIMLLVNVGISISPFLLWPIGKFLLSRNAVPGLSPLRATVALSTAAIVALAFFTMTLFHWNLVAYAAMLPFLAIYMRPRWLIPLQTLWGLTFAVAVLVTYAFVPLAGYIKWRDESIAWSYGWPAIAQAVATARDEHGAEFVGAADYTTASLLAFALEDRDVVSLSPRRDQYDYWFDPKAHAGQDAILYGDTWRPVPAAVSAQFESVTALTERDLVVAGQWLNHQVIYLAKGYRPHE